jgi:hypothetical protein
MPTRNAPTAAETFTFSATPATSIVSLAVSAGIDPRLAPLATTYVLITVIVGPLLMRLTDSSRFKAAVRRRTRYPHTIG